jgi:ferredoxin
MTPFHFRQRLKKVRERALGFLGRRDAAEPDGRFDVEFVLPDGSTHRVTTEAHYSLHMASQLLETPIDAPCPDGHCGKCLVEILEDGGGLAPPSAAEERLLEETLGAERDPRMRLACHARLRGPGVRVKVLKVWDLEQMRGS